MAAILVGGAMAEKLILSYAKCNPIAPRDRLRWLAITGVVIGSLSLGVSLATLAGSIREYSPARSVLHPWRTSVRLANRVLVPNPTPLSRAAFVAFLVHLTISSSLAVVLVRAACLALGRRSGADAQLRWYAWAKLISLPLGLLAALWFKGNLRQIFKEHYLTSGDLFKLVLHGPEAVVVAILAAAFPVAILIILRKSRQELGPSAAD